MRYVVKNSLVIFSILLLSPGNASGHSEGSITTISAARLNESAAAYDGQTVFVSGYFHTAGHRWEFGITDHRRDREAECLNIGISSLLSAHRDQFDKMRVTVKGVFYKGDWTNAWCFCENGNGLVIDEEYLKLHYRHIVAAGSR